MQQGRAEDRRCATRRRQADRGPGSGGCCFRSSALASLLLALLLSGLLLPAQPLLALSLPWSRSDPAAGAREAPPVSALQEVAPPEAVQQLQAALARHQPVVEIVAPADDALLPPGPWSLKLRVHDWPLVDGGALGLGPHLVVQLDQEPPRRWTATEGTLPELAPGSHRLTVYAAQPWGEARRSPGAWQQIRLHRTAPNPVALPARGRPQLLPVSPPAQVAAEPLLLDWLLLDAPLQNLRGSADPWRLRVTINGEEVILDQQMPLWLRGWRSGRNAVRLELLDGRGDPLDPPFNSLVQEVELAPAIAPPRWFGARLSPAELAVLLGRTPPPRDPGRDQQSPAEADPATDLPPGSEEVPSEATAEPGTAGRARQESSRLQASNGAPAGAAPEQGEAAALPAVPEPMQGIASTVPLPGPSAVAPLPPATGGEVPGEPELRGMATPPSRPVPDSAVAATEATVPGPAAVTGVDATGEEPSAGAAAAAAATPAAKTPPPPVSLPRSPVGGRDEGT